MQMIFVSLLLQLCRQLKRKPQPFDAHSISRVHTSLSGQPFFQGL